MSPSKRLKRNNKRNVAIQFVWELNKRTLKTISNMDISETIMTAVCVNGLQISHRKYLLELIRALLVT